MKKLLALLFLGLTTSAFADFTVLLDAGKLRLSMGAPLPVGSVLVLVAAGGDNTFSNTLGGVNSCPETTFYFPKRPSRIRPEPSTPLAGLMKH